MRYLRVTICSFCLGVGAICYGQEPGNRPIIPANDIIVEPVDRYGEIPWEQEQAHLDNLAIELLSNPNYIGYIIVYAGKRSCAGDAQRRGVRAKKYLVEHRGVDWNRVIWKDAGFLEKRFVTLETQFRGAEPYPFYRPQPLPLTEVEVKACRAKVSKRKKKLKK